MKKITVKSLLNVMDDEQKVVIALFAYGVPYARTDNDGMVTVADCKSKLRIEGMNAVVTNIKTSNNRVVFWAEMCA